MNKKSLSSPWVIPNPCACGRLHEHPLQAVCIESGALSQLPEVLQTLQITKPFVVWDENTRQAIGEDSAGWLSAFPQHCFSAQPRPLPDEEHLMRLQRCFDPSCDFILGVGSGVINDLCKMLGKENGRATGIVATAPSMDGFASNSAAMEWHGIKKTIYTPAPVLVLGDVEVLRYAPLDMIRSGLGDMCGKGLAICEWEMASLVTGEYFCGEIAQMMLEACNRVMDCRERALQREPEAIRCMMEGLVLSGVAMCCAGVSRPASGTEHTLSHLWEMFTLARGKTPASHGLQVALGARFMLKLLPWLVNQQPDRKRAADAFAAFHPAQWETSMRRAFGAQAEALIQDDRQEGRSSESGWLSRLDHILSRWPQIQTALRPAAEAAPQWLAAMDAAELPRRPQELGLSDEDVEQAFLHSRDLRSRYILTSLLWDMGELDAAWEQVRLQAGPFQE